MTTEKKHLLAVLIDADNIPAKHVTGIFEEIATLGEAGLRRIYGDFSNKHYKGSLAEHPRGWPGGWEPEIMAQHAIIPRQQFSYVTGKNSSDIALVIDAMDILHGGRFSGFVLVSSDSDFTRLASRIREQGLDVFGIGERKTPEAFVAACNRFIYMENIIKSKTEQQPCSSHQSKHDLKHAFTLVQNAMKSIHPNDWTHLSFIGSQLSKMYPDFDSRTYGFEKLNNLIRAIDYFEVKGTNGPVMIRVKAAKPNDP